jgi:hypothetical protein
MRIDTYLPERLKDPMEWYYKADCYMANAIFILEEFDTRIRDGVKLKDFALLHNAINTVPYISSIAIELYLKGFLISKKVPVEDVIDKKHKIADLRLKCAEYESKFNNVDLSYLTDRLGDLVLKKGGVRYPDRRDVPVAIDSIKNSFELILNIIRPFIRP